MGVLFAAVLLRMEPFDVIFSGKMLLRGLEMAVLLLEGIKLERVVTLLR